MKSSQAPVMPHYFSPMDAATYCGLSESSIEQLVERKVIAVFKPVITGKYSRKILIARQDLDAFMQRYRTPSKFEQGEEQQPTAPSPLAAA